jgi:hypothetical protein
MHNDAASYREQWPINDWGINKVARECQSNQECRCYLSVCSESVWLMCSSTVALSHVV